MEEKSCDLADFETHVKWLQNDTSYQQNKMCLE